MILYLLLLNLIGFLFMVILCNTCRFFPSLSYSNNFFLLILFASFVWSINLGLHLSNLVFERLSIQQLLLLLLLLLL